MSAAVFHPHELFSNEDPLLTWEIGDKIGEGSFAVVHKGTLPPRHTLPHTTHTTSSITPSPHHPITTSPHPAPPTNRAKSHKLLCRPQIFQNFSLLPPSPLPLHRHPTTNAALPSPSSPPLHPLLHSLLPSIFILLHPSIPQPTHTSTPTSKPRTLTVTQFSFPSAAPGDP